MYLILSDTRQGIRELTQATNEAEALYLADLFGPSAWIERVL